MYSKLYHFCITFGISLIINCIMASNKSFTPIKLSDNNEKCSFSNDIWVDTECSKILTIGPCENDDELLILDKEYYKEHEGYLKPVCEKKRCSKDDEIWWPKLKKCINMDSAKVMFCNHSDKFVVSNVFGEGVCSCWTDNYGTFQNLKGCYEYYKKGPCKNGEVVVYDILSGYAVCKRDQCSHENRRNKILSNVYAPMDGSGKCHILGTSGPCDPQFLYRVGGVFNVPKCEFSGNPLGAAIGTPDLCHIEGGKCKESVIVNIPVESGWDD